jgi:hypothetical protein
MNRWDVIRQVIATPVLLSCSSFSVPIFRYALMVFYLWLIGTAPLARQLIMGSRGIPFRFPRLVKLVVVLIVLMGATGALVKHAFIWFLCIGVEGSCGPEGGSYIGAGFEILIYLSVLVPGVCKLFWTTRMYLWSRNDRVILRTELDNIDRQMYSFSSVFQEWITRLDRWLV